MSPARPTLGDVARIAGVHKATASRALNPATVHRVHEDTARRVRAAALELGYRPNVNARGLRAGSTQSVGVIVPDILNPLYPKFIRGAEVRLAASDYFTLVVNSELELERERMAIDSLVSRQVDGLIAGATADGQKLLADAASRGLPVVSLSPPVGHAGIGTVETDYRGGLDEVAALLRDLGHRHIGHVAGPARYVDPIKRRQFLLDGLTAAYGTTPELPTVESDVLSIEGGEEAASRLLARHPDLTAVVAYNDVLAVGTLRALAAAGLDCPGDVTVVGFNDVPLVAELTPALTTVFNDTRAQGEACAEVLLEMLGGNPEPAHRDVPAPLVLRGSHGPARPRR